jgi:hypothetical protein
MGESMALERGVLECGVLECSVLSPDIEKAQSSRIETLWWLSLPLPELL